MTKRKTNDDTMPGADRDTSDVATVTRKKPQPKQVIDPITNEWRDETKAEKFVRLATHRTRNAIKRIRQLVPLGIGAQYESTGEQREKILAALYSEIDAVKRSFRREAKIDDGFSL